MIFFLVESSIELLPVTCQCNNTAIQSNPCSSMDSDEPGHSSKREEVKLVFRSIDLKQRSIEHDPCVEYMLFELLIEAINSKFIEPQVEPVTMTFLSPYFSLLFLCSINPTSCTAA